MLRKRKPLAERAADYEIRVKMIDFPAQSAHAVTVATGGAVVTPRSAEGSSLPTNAGTSWEITDIVVL